MCHRNLLRGTRGFLLLLSLGTAACGGGTVDASAVRPVSADQAQITAALAFARARQAADGRDWSAALAAAEQAVAADPRHDSAHLDAGWAAWCLGQPAKAAAHYQAVLDADPDNLDARVALGIALRGQGHNEEARRAYQAVLDAQPTHAAALYDMGVLLAEFLDDRPHARELFQRYLEVAPSGAPQRQTAQNYVQDIGAEMAPSAPSGSSSGS